jgi:hypothetical protein
VWRVRLLPPAGKHYSFLDSAVRRVVKTWLT